MGKLKYLVIHCTATPEGREVSGAEIRAWHTNPVSKGGRGWKQVGYTDLFHLNGGVERLVNNNEDANVDPWEVTNGVAGYNSVSRHIVYAGGCAKDGKTPADTRTSWQKKALEKYVKDFHRRFPDVRIVGHNELAAKACPSFDVQRWLKQIGITQYINNTMKRFLLFFVLILGFVSATFAQTGTVPEVDYSAMITTFAGFVGGVVLLTEGIKALFPKMQGLATQIVSWCVGIVAAMLLWWLDAGFVADATWYIALCYGFGASLVSNGVADTGFVQWLIGLFAGKDAGK